MAEPDPYGLLAEFETPDALMAAVRRVRAEGYHAFTPFPVDGLAELLDVHDRRVLWLGLVGAGFGFVLALAMQLVVNFDYPLDVGGRPRYALSAFAVVAFELTILFSALSAVFGMLYLNGLPCLNYPVFAASRFHLASKDRFFLCIKAEDAHFGDGTGRLLRQLGACTVELVRT